ncbi:esterase-like activity of phytase family protein [uncultured Megasphaera sp.]|uniref:esterase-like activity of phytase family protein n=1 Tax=uncultured Megasphaera sp. TaxID=165188 RepID=UPI0025F37FD0|nr:esterase-like activity of phytase family protein [uncultured Megasphaera sp.]
MKKQWKRWLALGLTLTAMGSMALSAKDVDATAYIVHADAYQLPYKGNEKAFNHHINPGYGSALALKSVKADGTMEFYAITDRGPNGDIPTYVKDGKKMSGKFFPTPNFTPSIGIIKVNPAKDRADIIASIPLKVNGKPISGKPIPSGLTGSTNEVALDFKMNDLGTDRNGLDTEGLALDKDGNFWISDEYGPFIAKVDKKGNILEKYGPGMGLPKILADRVPNRGSEGLTVDEKGRVFALIQSPLNVDGKTAKTAKYTRIVELDPVTKETTMYAYPVDTGYKNTGAAKIGDITSIGKGQFLMIEQGKQHGEMQNLIYKVDLNGATPIADNGDLEYGRLDGKIVPAKKELVLDLRAEGWNIEKAEGLALLPDRKTIAVVNDNDFGMDIDVKDSAVADPEVSDYTYDSDKKAMIYNKDNKVHKVKISLKKNAPTEQESQIWFFTLPKAL